MMKQKMVFILLLLLSISTIGNAQEFGKYFPKKEYVHEPVATWPAAKDYLPIPILSDNPGWVDMYWTAWKIGIRNLRTPQPTSPFVSNYIDESFGGQIFQWDTIFMMMFARYGHDLFPAIQSLDNFYCRQWENGFIGRELRESDGALYHYEFGDGIFSEKGWKNTINPPLFSWAEVESFRITGDKSRLEMVLPVLVKYAEWLNHENDPDITGSETIGRMSTAEHKLFWNTPLGSGMDNTPRPATRGAGWVEMSAQMVIMYNNLAIITDILGKNDKSEFYRNEAISIGDRINKWCWNEEDGFYYDVLENGEQFKKKTIGGFWPLLAGVPSATQARIMVTHLKNKDEFWRKIVFPTLSADEEEFYEYGDYWCGGVWAPTNVAVIKGLERYGYYDFAAEATEKYLTGMHEVFEHTFSVHENYAPDHYAPGQPAKKHFVGWSGCGPIQLLFENVMGLQPDGANNKLVWRLRRTDEHGVQNMKLGDNTISVVSAERNNINSPAIITVECTKPFQLKVIQPWGEKLFDIKKGKHILELK